MNSNIEKHLKNLQHEMEQKTMISNSKITQLQNEIKENKEKFKT